MDEQRESQGTGQGGGGTIGLFGLVGITVGSCIGSGAFALTGQVARVAAPGSALLAWAVAGVGFLLLALSLKNLGERRPDLDGIFSYAQEGFGPFAGFLSGWGYWISCWLGNVAFANAMMSAIGLFVPALEGGNTPWAVLLASLFMWAMVALVLRGMESASFLNALVMVAKVLTLGAFAVLCAVSFSAALFSHDLWGTLQTNLASTSTASGARGPVASQVVGCLIIFIWCFMGIEGASVLSSRARRRVDAGRATVIGLGILLVVYVGVSVLPYGVVPYETIAAMGETTSVARVFQVLAPGWGLPFTSVAMVVAVAGCWLSFTILPAETTQLMADHGLLPGIWGRVNDNGAPVFSVVMVGVCTQVFLVVMMFSESAYGFASSICAMAIVVTWGLAAAYQMRLSAAEGRWGQWAVGLGAVVFLVAAAVLEGTDYLLLACVGYLPGLVVFLRERARAGMPGLSGAEWAVALVICLGAALALGQVVTGAIVI